MKDEKFHFYVSCTPGIERVLEHEARQLGLIPLSTGGQREISGTDFSEEERGGILFEGYYSHILKSNLHLRTASRISIRLGEFYAIAFSELRKKASRLEWEKFLSPGQAVNIRAVCHKSRLYHSDGVAERVLGAINDHFLLSGIHEKPCRQEENGQMVLVRLVNDHCTISIDSSGDLLHKRGYRQAVAKAPLRETLAAAMLLFSHWEGQIPLIDPFCGSGTIPIEAALIASKIPPGITRDFAFLRWPIHKKEEWSSILDQAKKSILPLAVPILGYDRDRGAIESATANAARAGQKEVVKFLQQPISLLEPLETPGWIVTNPPYGIRVSGNKDLRDLYARFGDVLLTRFKGWKAGILCNDPKLIGNLNIGQPIETLRFSNGGIAVQYTIFEIT